MANERRVPMRILAIGAHPDDVEIIGFHGIQACANRTDASFFGIEVSDGSGCPRKGKYAPYTDQMMREERSRDDQIALAFPVVVIGDDDEFTLGKGLQNFLDRIGHFLKTRALCWKCISRTLAPAPASMRRAERR